jgi:anti-sigma factor RsiW
MLWRRKAIVCRRAVELVTAYLEGALAPRDRARFEAHIADCRHCTEYLEQMRRTLEILGRIEPDDIDDETRTELVSLYRRWIQD